MGTSQWFDPRPLPSTSWKKKISNPKCLPKLCHRCKNVWLIISPGERVARCGLFCQCRNVSVNADMQMQNSLLMYHVGSIGPLFSVLITSAYSLPGSWGPYGGASQIEIRVRVRVRVSGLFGMVRITLRERVIHYAYESPNKDRSRRMFVCVSRYY